MIEVAFVRVHGALRNGTGMRTVIVRTTLDSSFHLL